MGGTDVQRHGSRAEQRSTRGAMDGCRVLIVIITTDPLHVDGWRSDPHRLQHCKRI